MVSQVCLFVCVCMCVLKCIIVSMYVGVLYLLDINPVAYDTVCGLRIFLSPLHVVRIVVSFQNSDWIGCVVVELSIVGLCCAGGGGGANVTD